MSLSGSWVEVYIGLGSNLDHPLQQLRSAVEEIKGLADVRHEVLSPFYLSQPVGPQDQPDYINAVQRIKTSLSPLTLLRKLQAIEDGHARVRLVRWGARTLDLDILLYGKQIIELPDLRVPHPEMANRAFVLFPLADIAPTDMWIPGKGQLSELLPVLSSQSLHRMNNETVS